MVNLYDYMRGVTIKLNVEVQSLDTLRYVVNVVKEVREKESSIEMEITPILDMYSMLEYYLPDGLIDKEEIEQRQGMASSWRKVVENADQVSDALIAVQGDYKKQLVRDIRDFVMDIRQLRKDFEENGPLKPGIQPQVAVEVEKNLKLKWTAANVRWRFTALERNYSP